MTDTRIDLPQGTLDLLIKVLGPTWLAISERFARCPATRCRSPRARLGAHRLERRGWITARWDTSDNNRRAKYYELTRAGLKQLKVEADDWHRLTTAVSLVLGMT